MNERLMQLARDKIACLAGQGRSLPGFWHESTAVLTHVVPHYSSPCWHTLDPASLLVTSHVQTELSELPAEWLAHEYFEDDVHKFADVARSGQGLSTIHDVTHGEPSRSPGWRKFIQPLGGDQELLLALRTRDGVAWGLMGLYREPERPLFSAVERRFLLDIAPYLAEGARRALILAEAAESEGPEAPGLVVLGADWSIESLTPGVDRWLAELPGSEWERRGRIPPAVLAVAARALRSAEGPDAPGEVAVARVLSSAGRWVVLHGAPLVSSGGRRVAVIVEPAHPARLSSLLMAAYALTERERDVTRLVLQGFSTSEIANSLSVSTQTVQQHLKSIFEKTAVRSRRELVGRVFFAWYEPRLRDNETRALAGRPLRGGPLASRPSSSGGNHAR